MEMFIGDILSLIIPRTHPSTVLSEDVHYFYYTTMLTNQGTGKM